MPESYTYDIACSGLSGSVTFKMAGGDFWDGLCNGLISSGLNHAMHLVVEGGVFAKGCLALGISSTEPIPEELQNDTFLKKHKKIAMCLPISLKCISTRTFASETHPKCSKLWDTN